jgi:hypothetical protein
MSCTQKRMSPRYSREQSWKLKSQRTTLRLEWTWQSCVIDHIKRCMLLEAARHGKGLRQILSWPQTKEGSTPMDPDINIHWWVCSESEEGSELNYSPSERDEESRLPHMDWAASSDDGLRLCPRAHMDNADRVELLLPLALCQGVISDCDCWLGKSGTCLALQVGEDLFTWLLQSDAASDITPPIWGMNGGARADLLVLSNREMPKDTS